MTAAANQEGRGAPGAADLVQVIAHSPLLRSIDRSSLDGLGPELEWIDLDAHDVLSLDGSRGDALYFVASGRLEITHASGEQCVEANDDGQVLAVIVAGDVISEMRALTGSEDLAVVRSVTAAHLVRLAKEGFDRYLATRPDIGEKLGNIFTPRFYHDEMVRVLHDMFGSLTDDVQADIEQRLAWRHVVREDALFRQGESSTGLFVVVSGRLRELTRNDSGEERVVARATAYKTTVLSIPYRDSHHQMLLECASF